MFFYERWDNEAEETKFYEKYWENKKLGKGVTLSGSRGIKVFACILGGGGKFVTEPFGIAVFIRA